MSAIVSSGIRSWASVTSAEVGWASAGSHCSGGPVATTFCRVSRRLLPVASGIALAGGWHTFVDGTRPPEQVAAAIQAQLKNE